MPKKKEEVRKRNKKELVNYCDYSTLRIKYRIISKVNKKSSCNFK
jgi:hypothetical protein